MNQAEHAAAFGEMSRGVIGAALEFTEGVRPHLSQFDVARAYLAAAVLLASGVGGRTCAVELLRDLADSLERGEDQVKPN
jgi:hypothetical protein